MSDSKHQRTSPVTGETYEPHHALRHTEIATFMRAPLARSLDEVDIALVGIPFDGGVTHRPGARHGPREIRNMSTMMRSNHHVTRFNPFEACRIGDVGDVRFENIYHLDESIGSIERFYRALADAGVTPLAAGGDHSVTYPILKVLGEKEPLGLVHVDAHTDTWGPFQGSKFHHGAPFRLACDGGHIDPKRTIQIAFAAHRTRRKDGTIRVRVACGSFSSRSSKTWEWTAFSKKCAASSAIARPMFLSTWMGSTLSMRREPGRRK